MKIALLTKYFLPNVGGIQIHIFELAKVLVSKGHEVYVICYKDNESYKDEEVFEGIHIIRFSAKVDRIHFFNLVTLLDGGITSEVFRILEKITPDIVHVHGYTYTFLEIVTLFYSRKYSKKSILTPHYHEDSILKPYMLFNLIVMRLFKRILCVTEKEKSLLRNKFFLKESCFSVVCNGVRKELLGLETKKGDYLLYIGSGDEKRKGLKEFINISNLICEKSKIKFTVVGKNTNIEEFKSLVNDKYEDRFVFCGIVDREKLLELEKNCFALMLPSYYEAFGIVLVEAMALGKPVLSTNVGGIPEVVKNGYSGILLDSPLDTESWANSFLELEKNQSKYVQLSENARKEVNNKFLWENSAEKLMNVYKELCNAAS